MDYLWIGIGAAAGANGRYLLGQAAERRLGAEFPYGTLLVNITGSFLIGLLAITLADRLAGDGPWRPFLIVGLLGGYTTFSSFSLETIRLLQEDRWLPAVTYVLLSTALGLLACYGGIVCARMVTR